MRDGYIHLSTAKQLPVTLEKHFFGKRDLVLVEFVATDLGPDLRWEPSRNGELFPHLYRPLPTDLARSVIPLPLGNDGRPELPEHVS